MAKELYPALLCITYLESLLYVGIQQLFFEVPFSYHVSNPGTTWFLCHLMVFNIVYAATATYCGNIWNIKVACPTLIGFIVIGGITGLLSGTVMLFQPDNKYTYFLVPQFAQDYVSYPVYFFGGVLAQKNEWMTTIQTSVSRKLTYGSALFSCVIVSVTMHHIDQYYVKSVTMALCTLLIFKGIVFKGILSMLMTLAITCFFMDYGNGKSSLTDFLSKGAYTAYIIQFLFPIPAAYKCFTVILNNTGNLAFESSARLNRYDAMYTTNDHLLFPGWLLVSAVALLIIWPMAHAVQSILLKCSQVLYVMFNRLDLCNTYSYSALVDRGKRGL